MRTSSLSELTLWCAGSSYVVSCAIAQVASASTEPIYDQWPSLPAFQG